MKYNKNLWFTLIEMMIAITIFFIIVVMAYANYSFYQNIASVKIWAKQVSQSIWEARNMSINWFKKNETNQSIWILFDTNADNNKSLKVYSYNYSTWTTEISLDDSDIIREISLQRWVELSSLTWNIAWNIDSIMIYFSSIYWTGGLYKIVDWSLEELEIDDIEISISYKGSTNSLLKRDIRYYKNTNLIDY